MVSLSQGFLSILWLRNKGYDLLTSFARLVPWLDKWAEASHTNIVHFMGDNFAADRAAFVQAFSAFIKTHAASSLHRNYSSGTFMATKDYWLTLFRFFDPSLSLKASHLMQAHTQQHWHQLYPIFHLRVDEAINNSMKIFQTVKDLVDFNPVSNFAATNICQEEGSDTETEALQADVPAPNTASELLTLSPTNGIFESDYCADGIAEAAVRTFLRPEDDLNVPIVATGLEFMLKVAPNLQQMDSAQKLIPEYWVHVPYDDPTEPADIFHLGTTQTAAPVFFTSLLASLNPLV
ncbi:hypothetical protein DXG01_014752 [Tephrocybe rancida]|nr:hypothetical protein DXG01_014752 [Tephrocybe rancida]